MKKFLFLFLFPISYFLFPSLTHAQEVSLVVSPPRIDITANPGETIQKTIKITNDSADRELILQARTFDFIVQDNLGTPIRVTETASGRYLASPWFTLERSELVIPPKSTTQLVAIITIPQDALPGGHYAGVFFEPVTNRGGKNTVSYTTTQVGSLFGITIAGDIKYDALVKSFQTKLNFNEFGPIDFTAELENQSDTHIRPTTKIVIHDMLGRQLTELPLDEVNIFPYTSRLLNGTWNQVWGFGRYTATLSAAYGPGLVASRTIYFWIMPYRLIAAIVVALDCRDCRCSPCSACSLYLDPSSPQIAKRSPR
ncbi:MAG: hypothetical protein UX63_C0027G0004 [Microgenomates group bacterium GW2011_GWB1_46_7]|nr:MAG: hypothetical protein UX63_C0027G0004 [Microgenomates group bacterium GW2011_GWB1_46_7]